MINFGAQFEKMKEFKYYKTMFNYTNIIKRFNEKLKCDI